MSYLKNKTSTTKICYAHGAGRASTMKPTGQNYLVESNYWPRKTLLLILFPCTDNVVDVTQTIAWKCWWHENHCMPPTFWFAYNMDSRKMYVTKQPAPRFEIRRFSVSKRKTIYRKESFRSQESGNMITSEYVYFASWVGTTSCYSNRTMNVKLCFLLSSSCTLGCKKLVIFRDDYC